MKQNKPEFNWDKETGIAKCILNSEYGEFIGTAKCHPEDNDMISEKVGCEIAYNRAIIASLKFRRDSIIKPSLQALNQLLYSMKHSKNFNAKSYENKMLWRQIQNWKEDLNTTNQMITALREKVRDYIFVKEVLYQKLRLQRKQGQK